EEHQRYNHREVGEDSGRAIILVASRSQRLSTAAYGSRLEVLVEFVADAPDGEDVFRLLGILFELRPEPINMRIDVALVAFVGSIPDHAQQIVAGIDVAGI